jgi:hypothetical protein
MTDFMRDEPSAPAVVDRGTLQAGLDALLTDLHVDGGQNDRFRLELWRAS